MNIRYLLILPLLHACSGGGASTPASLVAVAPEPLSEPVTAPQPVIDPIVLEPAIIPPEPVSEPISDPVTPPEPVVVVPAPVVEPTPEPVVAPVAEPEPVVEPEPLVEPEPVIEPVPIAEPVVEPIAEPEPDCDAYGESHYWGDYCNVQIGDNSLYAMGVQRILYCSGSVDAASQPITMDDYADGVFGPSTESDLKRFQRSQFVVDSGVVDSQTWYLLQQELRVLSQGDVNQPGAQGSYGFMDGSCAFELLFLQDTGITDTGDGIFFGSWYLYLNGETVRLSAEPII